MKRIGRALGLVTVVCLLAPTAIAQGEAEEEAAPVRQPGVWAKDGQPSPAIPGMPIGCRQLYRCNPPQPVMTSATTRVRTTPAEVMNGTCSAGAGPADDCNVCLSHPPDTACEWWTEEAGED